MSSARSSPAAAERWTTRRLLDWMAGAFRAKDLDAPRLSAEMLLSHVLGCDRLRLYTDADRPATPLELSALRELVRRALAHEPVQYLVERAWFFSLAFRVDRRVLIPRPCTETIVEHVLQHARATPGFERAAIGDVCTGSGCIAIALLKNLPQAHAAATDLSPDALAVAAANAGALGVADRLTLLEGDLVAPLAAHPAGRELHYLAANPPYIPDAEWDTPGMVGANVKGHEPEGALRGGPDGLKFVAPIIRDGPERLRPGGLLLVEIAASTAARVLELAAAQPLLEGARVIDDHEGHPRVLWARRRG
ncbi:MAG: peptide chain release factor N(5)-glutamine methyltransferase [Phycisphaerales bacterium]|nr:peptide chain release factor N(5)-glutamine methyltransferase [Phycisphaerales bacterium]